MPLKLQINPNAELSWRTVGDFGTIVLVVDDFLQNGEELRSFALSVGYDVPRAPARYPGLHSYATLEGSGQVVRWIADRVLDRMFSSERPPTISTSELRSGATFAVLACDRRNMPSGFHEQHVDVRSWLASVLHLSLHNEGRGTAFWEHRPTGLQSWFPGDTIRTNLLQEVLGLRLTEQVAVARQRVAIHSNEHVLQMFQYREGRRPFSTDEDERWKLLDFVPAKFNRLVVYPTWQIHSIIDTTDFDDLTVQNMRLTMNQFVEYPVPRNVVPTGSVYPWPFYRTVEGLIRQ